MVLLAAGDYHHHIALNTWLQRGLHASAARPHRPAPFRDPLPDRVALAAIVGRLLEPGYPIDDAQDHGGTVAVYLRDPDGNGIELSYDLPRERWFDAGGNPVVKAEPFDPRKLLAAKGA